MEGITILPDPYHPYNSVPNTQLDDAIHSQATPSSYDFSEATPGFATGPGYRGPIQADRPRSLTTESFPPHNSIPSAQLDGALAPPSEHRRPIPAGGQPTNFIHVSAVDSVRGVYTIDPGLSPPASLIVSTPHGSQGRQNAFIESQKGNVNLDLFVLPSSNDQSVVSMTVKSQNGSACVRVHDAEPQYASYTRGPLSVIIIASKKVDIYIPHSFKGPLQMFTGKTGEVYYSEAVRAKVAPIFYGNGQHKSFIGGLPIDKDNGQAWVGDQLTANANEMINIYYDDENNIPSKDTSKGYLAQLQHQLTRSSQAGPPNTTPTRPLHAFRVRVARTARAIIPDCIRRLL